MDPMTSVLYGVRTYQGKIVCEKSFNSDRSNPIREKMPDIPIEFLMKKIDNCSINNQNIKQCKGHFNQIDSTCNHGDTYNDIAACIKCSDYYIHCKYKVLNNINK